MENRLIPDPPTFRVADSRQSSLSSYTGGGVTEVTRLIAEYDTAEHFYAWAVGEFRRKSQSSPPQDLQWLSRVVKQARADCYKARSRFVSLLNMTAPETALRPETDRLSDTRMRNLLIVEGLFSEWEAVRAGP